MITDAMTLANQICGCATPEQHKADVAALLEYREQAVAEAVAALAEANARIAELEAKLARGLARNDKFPFGTRVRKASGPEWVGIVVGHYSSSFTPEGLVIECTVEGARGQVHVEPAKRMEIDNDAG